MTYELAKELKASGFPQGPATGKGIVYVPTLSELIEACGDSFVELTAKTYGVIKGFEVRLQRNSGTDIFFATTPDEALARLYIALHKSKAQEE